MHDTVHIRKLIKIDRDDLPLSILIIFLVEGGYLFTCVMLESVFYFYHL